MSQQTQEKPEASRVPLSAFVTLEQHRAVAARAKEEDRSVSAIVRIALNDYLEHDA